LALLEENGISSEVKHYLEESISETELREVLGLLKMTPRALMRTKESEYKELGLDEVSLSDDVLIEAMIKHPKLIERPIVIHGNRAVLGRPPENVLEII
jgi:arsenate reductase